MDTKEKTNTPEIIEGTVVEEPTTVHIGKKEIIKIAGIVGATVLFHVGCALVIRKIQSSTPAFS